MQKAIETKAAPDRAEWRYDNYDTSIPGTFWNSAGVWGLWGRVEEDGSDAIAVYIIAPDNSFTGERTFVVGDGQSPSTTLHHGKRVNGVWVQSTRSVSGSIRCQFNTVGYSTAQFDATLEDGKQINGSFNFLTTGFDTLQKDSPDLYKGK